MSCESVLVTGASGFLGRYVVNELRRVGHQVIPLWKTDLTQRELTLNAFQTAKENAQVKKIDFVVHLAGYNGNVQKNIKEPATILARNALMGLHVFEASRKYANKLVSIVASCAFPAQYEICVEDRFFDGPPHHTVSCHGYAKRLLQALSASYKHQHGFPAVCLCPTTLYGPGDSFNPAKTKLVGALIKRFVDAADANKQEEVLWGTGVAKREFLFVEDAARLIVQAMSRYDNSSFPLNLGTGQELSVKELAELIAELAGFRGKISWDSTQPDGQLRKRLDLTRMKQILPHFDAIPLREGLQKTINYYRTEGQFV